MYAVCRCALDVCFAVRTRLGDPAWWKIGDRMAEVGADVWALAETSLSGFERGMHARVVVLSLSRQAPGRVCVLMHRQF